MKASEFIFHGPLMSSVKAFLTIACLWDIVTAMNSGGFYPHIPRVYHLLWNILNGLGSNALFAPFSFAFSLPLSVSRSIRKNRFTFSTNVSLYLNGTRLVPFPIEIYCLQHKQWMKIRMKRKTKRRIHYNIRLCTCNETEEQREEKNWVR